jgi:NAD(P)-dependent dehydrogenase (short-subunit alcohol dehydrogenase family)
MTKEPPAPDVRCSAGSSILDLSGQTALVTGASSGIGRETAVLLSELGARVVLNGRDETRLNDTLTRLHGDGHRVEAFDLAAAVDQIPAWIRSIAGHVGPLSALAHCAGVHLQRPLRMLDAARFEEVQRINVTTAVMLAKGLRQKGCFPSSGSSIVLLSSVTGLVGQPGITAYAASKSALLGVCRCLALELAPDKLRVNCVAPGMVRTEMAEQMFQSLSPEQVAAIEAAHPLGFGKPRDVANAVAFLLSEASSWITGSTLTIDGGYTAR